MKRVSFVAVGLFLCLFFGVSAVPRGFAYASPSKAVSKEDDGFFAYFDDDLIDFFEKEIIKKNVISDIPQKKIERLASHYGVSEKKLRFLIGIKYMLDEGGDFDFTLKELTEKNDAQITLISMTLYNSYWKKLSDGEKRDLAEKFEKLNKKYKFY